MTVLTITGVDAKTSADFIKKITHKYRTPQGQSAVEFAILRSPKVDQTPRYPGRDAIRKITSYVYPGELAFHLCGRYARMVLDNDWNELCDIIDFGLVGRVQVNAGDISAEQLIMLQRFATFINKPVIMQSRENTLPWVQGLSVLQDRSGGNGVTPESWAPPEPLYKKSVKAIGYAGGLGPDNIRDQHPLIHKASRGFPFWIDCESNVRTEDNWLDQDKVEAMCAAVFELKGWKPRD